MAKVIIVDDAVTVRMYHRQLMESMGYEVEEAANGVEALEKALADSLDLFLVDINMPKMDGYRLVQEMRRREDLAGIPVIMISTEAERQDREKAFMAGANYYITKPTRPDVLSACAVLMTGGK